jgi:hypothetical protein
MLFQLPSYRIPLPATNHVLPNANVGKYKSVAEFKLELGRL